MRGLFLKIFVWFWLSLALLAVALIIGFLTTRAEDVAPPWLTLVGSAVQLHARNAAATFEQGGPHELEEYLNEIKRTSGAEGHLFDQRTNELSGDEGSSGDGQAADEIKDLASRTTSAGEVIYRLRPRSPMAAQRVTSESGATYVFVLRLTGARATERSTADWQALGLRVALVMFTAGVVCYGFARYLVAPVRSLRLATRRLADGDLSARVGPSIGRRRDELADMGRDFDRMAGRIESLIQAQSRLLGDISHELRSPLARLSVALELARRQLPGPEVGAALGVIEEETELLDTLIGQLLALTRLESSSGTGATLEPIDLTGLVEEVAEDANFEAQGSGRAVHLAAADKIQMLGAPDLLRSAVENVVRNAIHYTAEGTVVEIGLRREASVDGESAVVRVRDHGAGVAEDDLQHLFQPFYRTSEARDRRDGGTGLGLAITERAVHFHHGSVSARNAPDGGLIVELRLPLRTP